MTIGELMQHMEQIKKLESNAARFKEWTIIPEDADDKMRTVANTYAARMVRAHREIKAIKDLSI